MQRNNGAPACASCRHQRKKCTNKCVLAPFFPANKSKEFHAVHKLFGVSNATKIIMNISKEEDRKNAAESLVWEAICWQKDPVQGPYGEHRRVYEELRFYRSIYQHYQVPVQYKATPSLNGLNSNNGLNYTHNMNGSVITDSYQYDYSSMKDNGSVILPQQHPINGFNQTYYLPGQYSPMDAKQMESAI